MTRINEERKYDDIIKHNSNSNSKFNNSSSSDFLSQLDQSLSSFIENDVDYGYGKIDAIWHISLHPSLPSSKFGFVKIQSQKGTADQDEKDNQYSFRKIEEAIGRGIRSGCDKVFLVADNEEMAKSISGKIEWLASFGSLIRLDAISLGMFPTQQQESAVITPSQKRVPQGKKIRKQMIKKREAKIEKHSKPKGRKRQKESEIKKRSREALLNKHNRPKGQRKRKER
jgi:hypothetical protein